MDATPTIETYGSVAKLTEDEHVDNYDINGGPV
jgi:hypothetical protein